MFDVKLTLKLRIIHPAPIADKMETARITMLRTLMSWLVVGADRTPIVRNMLKKPQEYKMPPYRAGKPDLEEHSSRYNRLSEVARGCPLISDSSSFLRVNTGKGSAIPFQWLSTPWYDYGTPRLISPRSSEKENKPSGTLGLAAVIFK